MDDFHAVEPMLDDRAFADHAAAVPLADRFGRIDRGLHAEVQRCGARPRILAVRVNGVVENLILVLGRSIVDAAVAAAIDFPIETKLEVVRNFGSRVNRGYSLCPARDHAILDDPVPGMLPAVKVFAVEQGRNPAACSSEVSWLGESARRAGSGRNREAQQIRRMESSRSDA